MIEKIIILEGKDDMNKISRSKKQLVISCDYESHKKLKLKEIEHVPIEDYFLDSDKKLLDEKTLEFSLMWYKELDNNQELVVNKICLGKLLEMEIMDYFCKILKKVIGITNLIEKEKPKKIIGYSLYPFLTNICKEKKIELVGEYVDIESSLFYDTIELPFGISKNNRIKISRKQFLKIKNTVENITTTLSNSKLNNLQEEYGLLLDFNLVQYEQLISELSKKHKIVMLNQRRPAIWNLQSFKSIKKSDVKILKLEQISNRKLEDKIIFEKNKIKQKIESICTKSKMNNYFMIKGNSFGSTINKNFKEIITKRFQEFVEKIYLGTELFETSKISYILEWAHNGPEEQIIIKIAQTKNIPVIFLQHAMLPLNKKWEMYHPVYPYLPTENTITAIWGKIMKNYLNINNISPEKVLEVGSPKHDIFFKEKSIKSNNYILIATNHFAHFNFAGSDTYAFERLEKFVRIIFEKIKEKTNKQIIVKLHPAKGFFDIKKLIISIDPNVILYEETDLPKLISSCDEVISLNFSTIILEAMILKKPTMTILSEKQDFENELVVKNEATLTVSELKELDVKFDKLFNNEIREKLVEKGTNFIDDYFSHQSVASQKIANELDKLFKS